MPTDKAKTPSLLERAKSIFGMGKVKDTTSVAAGKKPDAGAAGAKVPTASQKRQGAYLRDTIKARTDKEKAQRTSTKRAPAKR